MISSEAFTHHRAPYPVAGAAMRDVLRRANRARPPLGARERAVLEAVLMLTASYSKLVDTTTTREIAAVAYGMSPEEISGHHRKRTREILDRLATRGLIEMTPHGRGRSARVVVSILNEMTPLVGDIDDGDEAPMTPAGARNDPCGNHETTPASAAHLEDLEEFLEGNPFAFEEEVIESKQVDNIDPDWSQGLPAKWTRVSCNRCRGLKKPCTYCAQQMAAAS